MTIYLYEKHCTHCGLKYFGKCTSRHPSKYTGSGKYWKRHINLYGKDNIVTDKIWEFDSQEQASNFAIKYSAQNNIVESKLYANLIEENGLDGRPIGSCYSQESYDKISKSLSGKSLSEEHRKKIGLGNVGRKHSEETKRKMSETAIKRKIHLNFYKTSLLKQ